MNPSWWVVIIGAVLLGGWLLWKVARVPVPPLSKLELLVQKEAEAYEIWQAASRAHEFGDYEGHAVQLLRAEDVKYKWDRYLKAKAAVEQARNGGAA